MDRVSVTATRHAGFPGDVRQTHLTAVMLIGITSVPSSGVSAPVEPNVSKKDVDEKLAIQIVPTAVPEPMQLQGMISE
jgi:hypothetical protein